MIKLQKVHGSNNSFFLLDERQPNVNLNQDELIDLAKYLTSNVLGGADGLLVVSSSTHFGALGKMQVINADGSIASMCGNGLRAVARYLSDDYEIDQFWVETQNADLKVKKVPDWAPGVRAMSVEISPVSFNRKTLPFDNLHTDQLINQKVPEFAPRLKFSAIAVPNPHLISFVSPKILDSDLLEKLGTRLNQKNPYFPDGVNVNFAKIIDSTHLFVRTFERGVGFTNACGTGMSAASLAYVLTHPRLKLFDQLLTVSNPGGYVQTIVHQKYSMELIGNATVTHYLEIDENSFEPLKVTETDEDAQYQKLMKSKLDI
jgi:diaminopimelate epimerase